ncbi:MAG: putative porin [Flavobacteriaceae bacterium]|jgi:hypothetical protein|nr:putative porin [Flavobacteriaceae bacterium]
MRKYISIVVLLFSLAVQAQFQRLGGTTDMYGNNGMNNTGFNDNRNNNSQGNKKNKSLRGNAKKDSIAPIKDYKIISIKRDTIAVDTALSMKKFYKANYLRKDIFGLLPFANEGQTYNVLDYNYNQTNVLPGFGFNAKQFAYLNVDDINYYHVPTPYTELYYRSVMKQGQNLDALITMNTSKNLNFFVAYKGLRSLGKYMNQLSSSGNFRIGASYISKNKKYTMNTHFVAQDITNQENGGIRDLDLFASSEKPYNKRERLNVYFRDAETLLKGKRFFLNHQYQLNNSFKNGLLLTHEFVYEDKFFNYSQTDINSQYTEKDRYGEVFASSINNKTRYATLSNKLGAAYQSDLVGRFEFFTEFYSYDYKYKSIAYIGGEKIPDKLTRNITLVGGKYTYRKDKLRADGLVSRSLGDDNTTNLQASVAYNYSDDIGIKAGYQNVSRLGDLSYYLYQSDFVAYNWSKDFKNEKVNQFDAEITTPWLNVAGSYKILNDKLYFSNDATAVDQFGISKQVLVTPKQYDNTINYMSLKVSKDIKLGKFGLDNTLLYQNVDQTDNIVNVPEFLTRNTLYYTDAFFSKALKFQTGITFSYFSKYYANDYNPVIGDFYVQDKVKVGGYPVFDFFMNMKIRTARIYLMLEHFNAGFSKERTYYTAPNYPYRDFTLRLGLVWNFFS